MISHLFSSSSHLLIDNRGLFVVSVHLSCLSLSPRCASNLVIIAGSLTHPAVLSALLNLYLSHNACQRERTEDIQPTPQVLSVEEWVRAGRGAPSPLDRAERRGLG